jgi:hypothetical protein
MTTRSQASSLAAFMALAALSYGAGDARGDNSARLEELRAHGRCRSGAPPEVSALAPTDCSDSQTVINGEYNDGRVFVIPVVFHVIERTDGTTGVISDELIDSQIEILNEDFRAIAGTPGAGGADVQIEFALARFDPDGNPTTGIDRVVNNDYFTDNGSEIAMKTALRWDPFRYLNIYTNDAGGYLGYAYYPQSAGEIEDGVVLLWDTVGRNAPYGPPYDQGRTGTHEVGHYLGLAHTFEGGNSCGNSYVSGDLIMDTLPESQEQYGCPVGGSTSCGPAPIENYMDYTDDTCMERFTAEQANRMRCSMFNYRSILLNTKPTASFTADADLLAVTFTNTSTDAETPTQLLYSWDFGDGATSTDASPSHTYATGGDFEVTLEVLDPGSGAAVATETLTVSASPPDAEPGVGDDSGDDTGDDSGDDGGDDAGTGGGGCCHTAPGGGTTFLALGLPLVLVLRRRRRS